MTRSFYIAASSSPEGVSAARALASRLEGLGMRNRMAWWEHVERKAPEAEWPDLARRDLDAAFWCDVFVLLPEPKSEGALVELGMRLSRPGATPYVVGAGGHEFFMRHPVVRRVESVDELLAVLAGEGV